MKAASACTVFFRHLVPLLLALVVAVLLLGCNRAEEAPATPPDKWQRIEGYKGHFSFYVPPGLEPLHLGYGIDSYVGEIAGRTPAGDSLRLHLDYGTQNSLNVVSATLQEEERRSLRIGDRPATLARFRRSADSAYAFALGAHIKGLGIKGRGSQRGTSPEESHLLMWADCETKQACQLAEEVIATVRFEGE